MKRFLFPLLAFGLVAAFALAMPVRADSHFYRVESPDHGQTFAYGSERHRAWIEQGQDHHLALSMELTNDPYVDSINPRQYDSFIFSFPSVRLGKDGRTYYFRDETGHMVAVAERYSDFLGITEIRLLPNADLNVVKTHG